MGYHHAYPQRIKNVAQSLAFFDFPIAFYFRTDFGENTIINLKNMKPEPKIKSPDSGYDKYTEKSISFSAKSIYQLTEYSVCITDNSIVGIVHNRCGLVLVHGYYTVSVFNTYHVL